MAKNRSGHDFRKVVIVMFRLSFDAMNYELKKNVTELKTSEVRRAVFVKKLNKKVIGTHS